MATSDDKVLEDVKALSDALADMVDGIHDALDEEARQELESFASQQDRLYNDLEKASEARHERRTALLRRKWNRY